MALLGSIGNTGVLVTLAVHGLIGILTLKLPRAEAEMLRKMALKTP